MRSSWVAAAELAAKGGKPVARAQSYLLLFISARSGTGGIAAELGRSPGEGSPGCRKEGGRGWQAHHCDHPTQDL